MIHLLFLLYMLGHALADGPLQPTRLSKAKRLTVLALIGHAAVHGVLVAVITAPAIAYGRPELTDGGIVVLAIGFGFIELSAHAAIDHEKCAKRIGTYTDQALHAACKLAYTILVWMICHPPIN